MKGKKTKEGEDVDDPYPSTSAGGTTEHSRTLLTPLEMLNMLMVPFNRVSSSRRIRNAIFDVYSTLLTILGTTYTEQHYQIILSHFLPLASLPRSCSTPYEILSIRKLVGGLLREVVGVRILSEQGQIMAIREIAGGWLKKWPVVLPGDVGVGKRELVIGLNEVAGLLQQLGNASLPVQVCSFIPLAPSRSTF